MEIIKAKMKSLTKSFGEKDPIVLKYDGQEGILINNQNRKFVFNSEQGKLFVFISSGDSKSIKEIYDGNEIYIEFFKNGLGKLDMTKKMGSQKISAKFDVSWEIFKVEEKLIHIKYKILDGSSYLSFVEIFIETGGN